MKQEEKDQMVLAEKRETARKEEKKTWTLQMLKANQDMMSTRHSVGLLDLPRA